ncbi:MAG: SfnB family sulfur acquisition oxidoreductase [Rariglobus sp.]
MSNVQEIEAPPYSQFGPLGDHLPIKRPVNIIRSDEEAIAEATRLANIFRKGAIERDRKRQLPAEEIELITQAGLYGISVPKEYGGADVSAFTVGEVFRILSAADPSIGQIPQNHFVWLRVLANGKPEQVKYFFERVLHGDRIGNAHSENGRLRRNDHTHLQERVDGGYLITGKKYYSTGAIFAQWIPLDTDDPEPSMLFARSDAPGLKVLNDWTGMGQRTTGSGTTIFEKVFIPDENIFPMTRKGSGSAHTGGIIHTAIDLGIAEEALADLKNYIHTQARPWIENPFDEHAKEPLIIYKFGELVTLLHTAQALYRRAAEAIDYSRKHPGPDSEIQAQIAGAEARLATGEAAVRISNELFNLTGARATLEHHGLDRHWRNARTHTLHDPDRWRMYHIGNYHLNGVPPKGFH